MTRAGLLGTQPKVQIISTSFSSIIGQFEGAHLLFLSNNDAFVPRTGNVARPIYLTETKRLKPAYSEETCRFIKQSLLATLSRERDNMAVNSDYSPTSAQPATEEKCPVRRIIKRRLVNSRPPQPDPAPTQAQTRVPVPTAPKVSLVEAGTTIELGLFNILADSWLLAGEITRLSPKTLETRRLLLRRLSWFISAVEKKSVVDKITLTSFYKYLSAPRSKDGTFRWDTKPGVPRRIKDGGYAVEIKPTTLKQYDTILRVFFKWCIEQGEIEKSPLDKVSVPAAKSQQIQPFTEDQVRQMLTVAKSASLRDEAMFTILLDTGMRVSELCAITISDINFTAGTIFIRKGKGGKARTVCISPDTKRPLYKYVLQKRTKLRSLSPEELESSPIFTGTRGRKVGGRLTAKSVQVIVAGWGEKAGLPSSVRCSPHTFRHTFAILYLRGGGDVFTLMNLLGHTQLKMTNRYVAIAQSDINRQHAQFSPLARVKRGGNR